MIIKFKLSIAFKLLVIICLVGGLTTSYIHRQSFSIFAFFTNLSGLFGLLVFLISMATMVRRRTHIKTNRYAIIKGMCTVCLLITFLVYHFLLSAAASDVTSNSSIFHTISNILLHYVSPILVFVDYLFFDIKGLYRLKFPLCWLLAPLSYTVFVYIYSALGGRFYYGDLVMTYPYFFFDINELGFAATAFWIVGIAVAFIVIGYLLILTDALIAKYRGEKKLGTPVLR